MNVFEFGEMTGTSLLPHQKAILGELYGIPYGGFSLKDAEDAASRLIPFRQPEQPTGIAALMSRRMGATYLASYTALYEFYRLQSFDRKGFLSGDRFEVLLTTRRETATGAAQLLGTLAARTGMPVKTKTTFDAHNRVSSATFTLGNNSLVVLGVLSAPLSKKGANIAALVMDGITPHAKLLVEQAIPPMAMFRNPDGTRWGTFLVTDTTPELDKTTLAFLENTGLHTYVMGYTE